MNGAEKYRVARVRIVVGVGGAGSNLLETCGAGSRATYPQVAPKGNGGETSGVGRAERREWVKTAVIPPCPTPTTIGSANLVCKTFHRSLGDAPQLDNPFAGADGQPTAVGGDGQRGAAIAPTVYWPCVE